MTTRFDSLSLQIVPNAIPRWDGVIPYTQYTQGVRVINTKVPLTQKNITDYIYVNLDLWVEEVIVNDEETMKLKGVPLSVRGISKGHIPSVITPALSVVQDTYDSPDDVNLVTAELFGDAVRKLFARTGWSIKLDVGLLEWYPVVTEAKPAVVLNGPLINQLSELLGMFTPNDLWGQSLSFYVNVFEGYIIITTPVNSMAGSIVDITEVKPTDLSVRTVGVDLPEKLYIEESESALFRSLDHTEDYKIKTESYDMSTGSIIEEDDTDTTEIAATRSGERTILGGLVLSQHEVVSMTQRTSVPMTNNWGGLAGTGTPYYTHLTKGKSSEVDTSTKYTYIIGPPYRNVAIPWYNSNTSNKLFSKSLPGTRQEIARDQGCVKLDAGHYPEYLFTIDGIQVLSREVTTIESSVEESYFSIGGVRYSFPGDVPAGETVVTILKEAYMYSEEGYLVGERSKKSVQKGDELVITETHRTVSPISTQLSSELTFSIVSKYDGEESSDKLLETSVTDVSAQVVSAKISGPNPTSVQSAAEGTPVLRTKLLREYPPVGIDLIEGGTHSEHNTGVLYVTTECLTLEELEEYLVANYVLEPKNAYYVSFTSRHLDVRRALGGSVGFTFGDTPNTSSFYKEEGATLDQNYSMLEQAMTTRPFCVTGIAMDWEGGSVPEISVALCQLV